MNDIATHLEDIANRIYDLRIHTEDDVAKALTVIANELSMISADLNSKPQ